MPISKGDSILDNLTKPSLSACNVTPVGSNGRATTARGFWMCTELTGARHTGLTETLALRWACLPLMTHHHCCCCLRPVSSAHLYAPWRQDLQEHWGWWKEGEAGERQGRRQGTERTEEKGRKEGQKCRTATPMVSLNRSTFSVSSVFHPHSLNFFGTTRLIKMCHNPWPFNIKIKSLFMAERHRNDEWPTPRPFLFYLPSAHHSSQVLHCPSSSPRVNTGPCVGTVIHVQHFFHFYSFNMSCKHKAQILILDIFLQRKNSFLSNSSHFYHLYILEVSGNMTLFNWKSFINSVQGH